MNKLPDDYEQLASIGTGYSLTCPEFEELLKNEKISTLIKEWFGVQAVEMDTTELHQKIQNNKELQFTLYQRAMDIWR